MSAHGALARWPSCGWRCSCSSQPRWRTPFVIGRLRAGQAANGGSCVHPNLVGAHHLKSKGGLEARPTVVGRWCAFYTITKTCKFAGCRVRQRPTPSAGHRQTVQPTRDPTPSRPGFTGPQKVFGGGQGGDGFQSLSHAKAGMSPPVRFFSDHKGIFPCFFRGRLSRFPWSISRALMSSRRVCRGSMIESTKPRAAAE